MRSVDVLIIGGGQAGIPLARSLSQAGQRVVIAERKHLGGSCVNFGCTPTKAAIASARVAHMARRAKEFGVTVDGVNVDFARVMRRARAVVEASKAGLAAGLREHHVEILPRQARFAGRDADGFTMRVGDRRLHARQVVINCGARTHIPPIEGVDRIGYLDAGNWLDSKKRPEHVIFAGAGYIALEMAQFYRRMGSRVTLIGPGTQIIEKEDADIALALKAILEEEGIAILLGTRVVGVKKRVVKKRAAGLRITVESHGTRHGLDGSHLFIATGRRPNTDDLGLETIGLTADEKGVIPVDERLATRVPGVWTAGDARGGPMFTHTAWDDHRVLESQLLGDGSFTTAGRIVPYAIFTDPELGRVGMTEAEARREYGDRIKISRFEMKHSGKAAEIGETRGFIKLIADAKTARLLGQAVLAFEGAELVGPFITLLNSGATLAAVCQGIYIHPTLIEAVQSAALALELPMKKSRCSARRPA